MHLLFDHDFKIFGMVVLRRISNICDIFLLLSFWNNFIVSPTKCPQNQHQLASLDMNIALVIDISKDKVPRKWKYDKE